MRTLLIGVAILSIPAAYIGHEWRVVQERRNAFSGVCPCEFQLILPNSHYVRGLIGDWEYRFIRPDPKYVAQSKIEIARVAFPEAVIDSDRKTIQAQLDKKKDHDYRSTPDQRTRTTPRAGGR